MLSAASRSWISRVTLAREVLSACAAGANPPWSTTLNRARIESSWFMNKAGCNACGIQPATVFANPPALLNRPVKARPSMPAWRSGERRSGWIQVQRSIGSISGGDGRISSASWAPRPNAIQSSPNNSTGCWVRSEPLPHSIESAAQYRSQPQQSRSGCWGLIGNFLATACHRCIFKVRV